MSLTQITGRCAVARVALALFISTAGVASATAQNATDDGSAAAAVPSFRLSTELKAPLDLRVPAATDVAGVGSSSSLSSTDVAELAPVALGASPDGADGNMQPPPYRRRRYGQPNYNDRWHNKDGSNRLAFVIGGGFTLPTGATGKQFNVNYSLKGGAGINLSRKFAVVGEFNYDRFGLQGNVLTSQYYKYSTAGFTDGNNNPIDFSGLDASSYIWSFTLNPTFTFVEREKTSAYVVVGGGFYHKVVNFTLPVQGTGYSPYYGYYYFQDNQTFDHYADNAGGVNGGIGFTYKLSRFSNQKVFAEARYVEVFGSQSGNDSNSFYPPATARTGYFPVTVGLRW